MTEYTSLRVGNVQFDGCAFLAPLAGITDRPFRMLVERFGAASVTSEMIASAGLISGHEEMKRKIAKSGKLPHIVQLAGNEKDWLVRGAKIAADNGAEIIDFNLGCPSKRVTNGFAGSALMRVPDTALQLIEAVIEATHLPVTVKMRLGWNDDCLNAADIAKRAENAGVQMLAVHGRTRQQFYKGEARWNLVKPIVDAVSIPVLVNGDIISEQTAREALRQSGAAGVMCGRGAQGQPWLIGDLNAALKQRGVPDNGAKAEYSLQVASAKPDFDDLLDLMQEHYELMLTDYGVELGVRVARKHIDWYLAANDLTLDKAVKREILTNKEPDQTMPLLRAALAEKWSAAA